ncbi:MAG: hypothetical protein QOG13_3160 [Sphingomonadales bacterium]|jgi:hypothetical protein|nr:hypothetical protein [Sphingomonadales bacterium]MEA3043324.1 hypothetical protein [Sphingomonadales bacterium]
MKAFVVACCAVLLAGPALAQSGGGSVSGSAGELSTQSDTPESSGDANQRSADGERRICRRVETTSTSRMSTRRVCRTAQEWRDTQRTN